MIGFLAGTTIGAIQPAREGLARKELRQIKMEQVPQDCAYSSPKDSMCVQQKVTLGACSPSPFPFRGRISLVTFQIQAFPLLALIVVWVPDSFVLVGKCGTLSKSASGCPYLVHIREEFTQVSFSCCFPLLFWSKTCL